MVVQKKKSIPRCLHPVFLFPFVVRPPLHRIPYTLYPFLIGFIAFIGLLEFIASHPFRRSPFAVRLLPFAFCLFPFAFRLRKGQPLAVCRMACAVFPSPSALRLSLIPYTVYLFLIPCTLNPFLIPFALLPFAFPFALLPFALPFALLPFALPLNHIP